LLLDQQMLVSSYQCVKCGLCSSHCPTYLETRNENRSPRGRIALIQGLLENKLPSSDQLQSHLSSCLLCGACETVCPANVPYAELMDFARSRFCSPTLLDKLIRWVFVIPWLRTFAQIKLFFFQKLKIRNVLSWLVISRFSSLKRLDLLLPDVVLPIKREYASVGDVGLFIGCVSSLFDQKTIDEAISLLHLLGINVVLPEKQHCCGAIHQHQGEIETAQNLAKINVDAFAKVKQVVYLATGCGQQLRQYKESTFSAKVSEFSEFLYRTDLLKKVKFAPLKARVLIHYSCSCKESLKQQQLFHRVLSHIPEVEWLDFDDLSCCGAAGTYMITQPEMADKLGDKKANQLFNKKVDILVTSNIGCALHLQARLKNLNANLEVLHPAVLLSRQVIRS
jgi:glycolate oxidase iron-sulfur subunit